MSKQASIIMQLTAIQWSVIKMLFSYSQVVFQLGLHILHISF